MYASAEEMGDMAAILTLVASLLYLFLSSLPYYIWHCCKDHINTLLKNLLKKQTPQKRPLSWWFVTQNFNHSKTHFRNTYRITNLKTGQYLFIYGEPESSLQRKGCKPGVQPWLLAGLLAHCLPCGDWVLLPPTAKQIR